MYHTYMQHVTNFRFSSHVSHIIYSSFTDHTYITSATCISNLFKDRNKPIQTYIVLRHSQHQRIVMHPAPVQHMHRFRRPTHIKTTDPFKPTPASFVHVHIDAFQTAARGHFNRTTPSTSCHPSGVGTARTVGFPFHPIRQR